MSLTYNDGFKIFKPIAFRTGVNVQTLSANLTLTRRSAQFQKLSAAAPRTVVLPIASQGMKGSFYLLVSVGAADLTIKNGSTGGDTVVTLSQNERVRVVCDGTSWIHMGIESVTF